MTARLLREEARLRALFGRLVAASLSAASLGCSSGEAAAGADASSPTDAATGTPVDAGDATLADGGSAFDAPHDSACDPVLLDGGPDAGGCDYFERLACNLPPGTPTEGCAIFLVTCTEICGQTVGYPCAVVECAEAGVIPGGAITVECTTGKVGCADGGRRPAGLVDAVAAGRPRGPVLGEWLARLAWMEAASVRAFRDLQVELESMGAPVALVRAAGRAGRDEVRHARITARLARRHGGRPERARVAPRRARSVAAFAVENAVEGCVREAFAALVAGWQAHHAPDAELAAAMKGIAEDETRHAALAWAIAGWLEPQLDLPARAAVRASMKRALQALRCEVSALPAPLAAAAGLPHGREGAALVDAFAAALLA